MGFTHADVGQFRIHGNGLEVELRRNGEGLAQHIAEGQRDDHAALAVQGVGKGTGEGTAVLFQQFPVFLGQIGHIRHGRRRSVQHVVFQFLIGHPPSPPLFHTI